MAFLNYAPDSAAQSLRSRQTRAIGCLIPVAAHPVFAAMVAAAERLFRRAGYAMVLGTTTDRVAREADLLSFFRERRVDGLIATLAREDDPSVRDRLQALGCPVVLLDRVLDDDFDAVLTDQGAGCYEATASLLQLGHRRIALVTSSLHSRPSREREVNFRKAYAAAGLVPTESLIRRVPSSTDFGLLESATLLDTAAPPTAIIAGVHELVDLLRAIRARGLRVPHDISVIAFGDSDVAELADPPISIIRWDAAGVAQTAAQLLLDRIEGRDRSPARRILLPTELVIRHSCAPPAPSA
jgi:LacI family transcriptional regulator